MTKIKLLLISGISPFPQNSGGATRIKQTLIHLSKKYDIHLYFFIERGYKLSKHDQAFLHKHTVFFKAINLDKKYVLTSLLHSVPYHFSNYFSLSLIKELQLIKTRIRFDQVRVESSQLLYLAQYLTEQSIKFVALDISTVSFYRRAFTSDNPFKIFIRLLSFLQVFLYEARWLKKFEQVLVMSKQDQFYAQKIFKLKNTIISPNGIETIKFLPTKKNRLVTIGFVGSIKHPPNQKAIDYLVNNIFPALQHGVKNCQLIILGEANQAYYRLNSNIKFIDHLENLEDFYSDIDILVAPIFSGSGTRIKILESLSFGRPVITTHIGAEGITINSKYLIILSEENQYKVDFWVSEIIKIYTQLTSRLEIELPDLRQQLSYLTWRVIFNNETNNFIR